MIFEHPAVFGTYTYDWGQHGPINLEKKTLSEEFRQWCEENLTAIPEIVHHAAYLETGGGGIGIFNRAYYVFACENDLLVFKLTWVS